MSQKATTNNHHHPTKRGIHKRLLDDPDVRRWYDNISRGSKLTADVRLRRLGRFCKRNGTTPKGIIALGKSDIEKLDDLLLDNVTELEENYAPSYVADILKAIRSWLSFSYIEPKRKIRIKNADVPVTLKDEVVPTREKIDEVMESCEPRARTAICLMAFAGIRPQVMGISDATDGLLISDIEGLHVSPDGTVKFDTIPAKVIVRAPVSKAGHQYFTKLPQIGCDALAGYVRERIRNGEIVTEDSPVITSKTGYKNNRRYRRENNKFLVTSTVSGLIRDAFGSTIKDRPYVLRAYFDTQLLIAENRGKIAHAIRQFLMGHKGDMEAKYTTNKQTLPDALLREIDHAYMQSLPYLLQEDQQVSETTKRDMFLEVMREQAKVFGVDPEKLQLAEKQRPKEQQLKTIKNLISEKINRPSPPLPKTSQATITTRIVTGEEELLAAMNQSGELLKELSEGRFLVRCCCQQ